MDLVESYEARELSAEGFARFAQFITGRLGIMMPPSKLTMLQSRLLRRVRALRMETVEQYSDYFFSSANAAERERFISAITTNKTDFFREPEHFDYLIDAALPALTRGMPRNAGTRLQVWSAGCSSGEEPYTLAMILSAYGLRRPGFDFGILGTDVSTKVLDQARAAIYQESQVAPVPLAFRTQYIWRSRNKRQPLIRVVPEIRRRVTFHQLNFMDEDYGLKDLFHAIFFRNVAIYFDKRTQEAVLAKIIRNLAPGGYLFVGAFGIAGRLLAAIGTDANFHLSKNDRGI